ncbi:hypothetical protein [Kineococcus esterisolvens]|uniref:hypothetical protein n=1 Tax=unclassified Kineococcus TaxID=2621656 RepID=UPI003D7E5B0A
MDVLTGVLLVVGTLVGFGLVLTAALAGCAAEEGRRDGRLLVAPRGAAFGEASRLAVEAERAEQASRARVVHLDERRARRAGTHRAA